ncbi:Exocyst complex component Sec3, putative [Talaromyces stipitatus ATCC 10500]|uniref:Exocyst complex component Sec3, putative n=1 Tax=Talaromyces stipitatus (strain ATCC 10500 / CBS 375.48 / QM 6759 / NRRL 1006) TaxID=441959 RepID=B8MGK9_TALSN|nr:Exocyst complex component Sec3, putative [Talaromyces stipitatus ATCC 10500]EED16760.1 Exocyst complex component Sec3, putative [Talaromyces stipitatus ATCC 10500]
MATIGGPPPRGYERPRRPEADARNENKGATGDGSTSRAQLFQDEKRRIISSCFSKQDSDGALTESYITHIRITEDAAYPTTPAPPSSPPENKKARLIIVALRKSGRVRMHKARENNDGTFSIGKTWMLDDLTSIQCFSDLPATTPTEQQQKQWASNVGFVVTVGKPYYWQASNYKERDFFIASLVKIYKKYTGGRVPKLIGFDEKQKQALIGDAGQAALRPSTPSSQGPQPSQAANRAPSREGRNEQRPPLSEEQKLRSQRSRDAALRPSPSPGRPPQLPRVRDDLPSSLNSRVSETDRPPKPLYAETPQVVSKGRENSPANIRQRGPPQPEDEKVPYGVFSNPALDMAREPLRPGTSGSGSAPSIPPLTNQSLSLDNSMLSGTSSRGDAPPSRGSNVSNRSSRNLEDLPPALRSGSSSGIKNNVSTDSVNISREANEPEPAPTTTSSMPDAPLSQAVSETVESSPVPGSISETPESPLQVKAPVEPSQPSVTIEKPPTPPIPEETEDSEAHRPGLGPMIKKKSGKDIAGAFRRAATAYGAFKPRPGGAGERLLAKEKTQTNEPDGITSVVPAPLLRGLSSESTKPATPEPVSNQATPLQESPAQEPPKVEITRVNTDEFPPPPPEVTIEAPADQGPETVEEKIRSRSVSPAQERRRRRREDNIAKYCQALGVEVHIVEGTEGYFDEILTDLGWHGRLSDEKKIEDLEADIRREIGRVQATSWLGNIEQQEGKIDQLAKLIDRTIEECEELDGLLTLYSHELSTLHDDVAFIEAQSQGLQVQTANQKLLQSELQNLLKTLSISADDLRPLQEVSLNSEDGVHQTEMILSMLYKAMLTIDCDINQNKKRMADAAGDSSSVGVYADTEIGQMRAIREKKDQYRAESGYFLQRLRQFMSVAFKSSQQKRVNTSSNFMNGNLKFDSTGHNAARQDLWMYSALMLFAREVSSSEWVMLINLYEQDSKTPYQNELRDNLTAWKKAAKKSSGEESEILFTHHEKEKEGEGLTGAARKLTVRRGKTVRVQQGPKNIGEKQGRLDVFEVFTGALQETVKMISEEQNFIVQFFHLNSLTTVEFPDIVATSDPGERQIPDFSIKQMHDPDRDFAKRVEQVIDGIFSFWGTDIQNLVDWVLNIDQLQGVGVLAAVEATISEFEDTNQDFIVHTLQKLLNRLNGLFNRFVDQQIRGIEETKVKINKRKGVISFMRTFPHFSTAVENMLAVQSSSNFSDVRLAVNEAYNKINRAMWESLKFIAKEAPGQVGGATAGVGDPEDKEALNYHILLIENMNHYFEEVDVRGLPVLERWRDRAIQDYHEHMKLYMDAVIRRPLGKLLDFIESTESLLANSSNPTDIASRTSHSKPVVKKLLSSHDSKELRRGADLLKKRVEKHFGDADDPGLSRSLVVKVFNECATRYEDTYDRLMKIADSVYEGQVELDWSRDEASSLFRR